MANLVLSVIIRGSGAGAQPSFQKCVCVCVCVCVGGGDVCVIPVFSVSPRLIDRFYF